MALQQIAPLISSEVAGPLGVIHLPRLWLKVLLSAKGLLPDDYDEVRAIFSRRGAYARVKDLLVRRDALQRWDDFSNKAEEAALRQWCAENGIALRDEPAAAADREKKD